MKKMFSFVVLTALLANSLTTTLYAQDLTLVDKLVAKYRLSNAERPKSCPLESRKFADLLAKTETIKNIFKSNCLQKDENKMTEVLNSVKDIQDELKKRNIIDKTLDGQTVLNSVMGNDSTAASTTSPGSTSSTSSSGSAVSALSGIKFSTLFSNITTMIKKNQCNLDDGRVLEMTADLIYDSTQLGLLSGNELGLIVAGGGFIVSSALRLIDMIFKERFDFAKNQDRQTFIKLNCSFYDIRKDLEAQGALDVENNTAREDLKEAQELVAKMNTALGAIEQEKNEQNKMLASLDQQSFISLVGVGDVALFKKNLLKIKAQLLNGSSDPLLPLETQKLLLISEISQNYDSLLVQLNNYRHLKISAMPMLDDLFLQEIKKFDPTDPAFISETLNISAKDFNENQKARLLFHATRILSDITLQEEKASVQNQEIKKSKTAELKTKQELYSGKLAELKKLEERLSKMVAPKEYSASDDGSDNMLSLLENYKNISEQIYGEWGEKFLKYTTVKSYDEVKNFREKLGHFNDKYGERAKRFSIDKAISPYICQDIQRIRVNFKYADALVQEGYDFIVTNKDLFHTDARNYYNSSLDEEKSIRASSSIEKIQRHYKSTILALRKLKQEEVDPADEEKYLARAFGGSAYLGRSMIDVSSARTQARDIQEKFEQLNCHKTLVDDLN